MFGPGVMMWMRLMGLLLLVLMLMLMLLMRSVAVTGRGRARISRTFMVFRFHALGGAPRPVRRARITASRCVARRCR